MGLTLRPASMADAERLLAWRNDPVTRAMSGGGEIVGMDEHLAWLGRRLVDAQTLLLIGELEGSARGMVRFDRAASGAAEVSINVAPEARSQGLGFELLRVGCEACLARGFASCLTARIRPANRASLSIFEKAGFRVSDAADPAMLILTRDPVPAAPQSGAPHVDCSP